MGFLGTGDSAPPPPDYAAQARAQGEANKDAAYQTTVLSNPNIYTPTGSQTTTWGPANQGQPGSTSTPWQNQPLAGGLYSPTGGGPGDWQQNDATASTQGSGPQGGAQTTQNSGFNNTGNANQNPQSGLDPLQGAQWNPATGTLQNPDGTTFDPTQAYNSAAGGNGIPPALAGIPQATVNQHLSPTEQAKMDKNDLLQLSLLDTAQGGLGRVNNMMDTPFDMSNITEISDIDTGNGFNAQRYLAENPDVAAAGVDPYQHYQQYGKTEGRGGAGIPTLNSNGLQEMSGVDIGQLSPQGNIDTSGLTELQGIDTSGYGQYGNIDTSQLADQGNIDTSGMNQGGSLNTDGTRNYESLNRNGQPNINGLSQEGSVQGLDRNGMQNVRGLDQNGLPQQSGINRNELSANGELNSNARSYMDQRETTGTVGGNDRVYDSLVQRRQGQFDQQREQAESDLISRGFVPGSEGYRERMREIDQEMNDYKLAAMAQAGQEQQRLFNMESGMRDQDFGQAQASAQFAQQLRAQGMDEQQVQAQVNDMNRSQQFSERQDMSNFDMRRQDQQFGQKQAVSQFSQNQNQQDFNQRQNVSNFDLQSNQQDFAQRQAVSNDAQSQRAQQMAERGQIANFNEGQRVREFGEQESLAQFQQQLRAQGLNEQQIQAEMQNKQRSMQLSEDQSMADNAVRNRTQQFNEQERMAQFAQGLRAQGLSEQQIQAQVNNAMRSQQFGERAATAGFDQSEAQRQFSNSAAQNQATAQQRQQEIQEQAYLRSLPLNEINALRSGSQASLPQFQQYTGANVAPPPLFDAAVAQGNFDQASYANSPDVLGGLFSLGGAALGGMTGGATTALQAGAAGAFGTPSDIRLKDNLVEIGELGPLKVFEWDWNGKLGLKGKSKGFIAQQVQKLFPQFVIEKSGYLHIKYDELLEAI